VQRTATPFEPIPARAGIGLKASHYREILESSPDLGWFEVHPENYMGPGGAPNRYLEAIRQRYPLSLHGVGLSLGSSEALKRDHLAKLRALVRRYEPGLVSEHLAWSSLGSTHFNDLLPVPLTRETLDCVCEHVSQTQDFLKRRILIENPSGYLSFRHSEIPEPEFLAQVAERTGCGLLLDVNNAYVSACNLGFDAAAYLDAVPARHVGEIHLAGHTVIAEDGHELRIDDHGARVATAVWAQYERVVKRIGPRPTLIEWDTRIPPLSTLLQEAELADGVLASAPSRGRKHVSVA